MIDYASSCVGVIHTASIEEDLELPSRAGTAILCQHPSPGDPSCRKLFGQLWTGVVLFSSSTTDGLKEYTLLVERVGDTARRIGTVIYSGGEYETIPRRREGVRLASILDIVNRPVEG